MRMWLLEAITWKGRRGVPRWGASQPPCGGVGLLTPLWESNVAKQLEGRCGSGKPVQEKEANASSGGPGEGMCQPPGRDRGGQSPQLQVQGQMCCESHHLYCKFKDKCAASSCGVLGRGCASRQGGTEGVSPLNCKFKVKCAASLITSTASSRSNVLWISSPPQQVQGQMCCDLITSTASSRSNMLWISSPPLQVQDKMCCPIL